MSKFRRGFKAQSERRAIEVRKTLNLEEISPLSANILADHMGVRVWSAQDIQDFSQSDLNHLLHVEPDEWPAFTIRIGEHFLVVYNPSQSPRRINSVLMHELSHIILGHELTSAGTTTDGHLVPSNYDEAQEAEADWLGGALLLPRPTLLWMRKRGMSKDDAADHFHVSHEMLNWRIRMTGVDHQMRYSKKKQI